MNEGRYYRPKEISKLLGIPDSKLPRFTYAIIGQPIKPPRKAGATSYYSFNDAVAMKVGHNLMDIGLSGTQARRRFVKKVLEWLKYPNHERCFLVANADQISFMDRDDAEWWMRNDSRVMWLVNLDEVVGITTAELAGVI